MVAAVAMTAIAARRLTGSGWAGLLTGLIMAVTPNISYYAQTARSYALVVACVMAATLSLLRVMEAEAVGVTGARLASRWLLYGALVTLSGYLNELSLMILAAHAVTVLLARAGWRTVGRWAVTAAAVAVLVTPLVAISVREDGAVGWIARPSLDDLRILFHNDFGATTAVAVFLLGCAVAAAAPPLGTWRHGGAPAAAGAGVPRERAWWASGGISLPSVAVPLLIMPPLVLMAESLVAHPLYVDRYVLYTETGAALLAGAGIHRISRWLAGVAGRRSLRWAPGAIVCACALLFQLGPQHTVRSPASREFNYGAPSSYIGAHARPGDGVLFFNSFFRKARLGYPSDFRKISDFAMSVSPAQAGTFNGRDKPFAVIRPLMLQRRRIWVVGRAPSAKLGSWPIRHESMLLQQRFALVAERQFRGIIVTLWLRR
jgi:mannosyltransferase